MYDILYLLVFPLPKLLPLEHGLDAVGERSNNPHSRGFKRDRLPTEIRVNWRVMKGPFKVGVIASSPRGEGFGEGEGVTTGTTVAPGACVGDNGRSGVVVCER